MKFLEKLLEEDKDHPGVIGHLHWGPLLGWGWMSGKPFHTGWGYCAPVIDTRHDGDWGKIGRDAINGIKACALSLGAVFTVCRPQCSADHSVLICSRSSVLFYPLSNLSAKGVCRVLRKLKPPPGHSFHVAHIQRAKKDINMEMLYVAPSAVGGLGLSLFLRLLLHVTIPAQRHCRDRAS